MASASVTVDSAEAVRVFDKLQSLAGNLSKPLALARDVMEQATRQTFRDASDPWGAPWPALRAATLASRTRRGNTRRSPLIDIGAMYASISSGADATQAWVSIGGLEDRFPEVHQFGDGKIPARAMLPMTRSGATPTAEWINAVMRPLEQEIEAATT